MKTLELTHPVFRTPMTVTIYPNGTFTINHGNSRYVVPKDSSSYKKQGHMFRQACDAWHDTYSN